MRDIMADRSDLIQSELAGLCFDATQELFSATHLDNMFNMVGPLPPINCDIFLFVDPAAGGPSSDYAILSVTRHQGVVMVSVCCCLFAETEKTVDVDEAVPNACGEKEAPSFVWPFHFSFWFICINST
jgi:hypothetical protein